MDKTYTIIPDFMLDYDLTMTETIALAVIYGFSQDGKSNFHGSYSYLARKCKCSTRWAIDIVTSLVQKGYVSKRIKETDGAKTVYLKATIGGEEKSLPVNSVHGGSELSSPGGSELSSPNIIDIENIDKRKNNPLISPFDFVKALKEIGVTEQLAREWMAVRKTKRLTNTRTAFDQIAREIAKTGRPATDCVRLAVENSWGGFKAEWMKHETQHVTLDNLDETIRRLNDGTYTG